MLFKQPFKIEQSIGIWLGLDTSFNGFKEDKSLLVHEMQFLNIRQDKGIISKKIRHHFFEIFIDKPTSRVQYVLKWVKKKQKKSIQGL